MGDSYNRKRSANWRELAMLLLRAELGLQLKTKPVVTSLSTAFAADPTGAGDIHGIPGWTVNTTAQNNFNPSAALDELERDRLADGNKFAGVIQYRRARPTEDAYVLMSLNMLIRLIEATS